MRADLHTHTIFSDGKQTPEELAFNAKKTGVALLAVTDHDNMDGDERKRAAAEKEGIFYVSGIEISAYTDVKVHIMGYGLDSNSEAYRSFMERRKVGSYERAEDVIKKLSSHKIFVTLDEVEECHPVKNSPLHTMHIARAVAKKGYYPDEFAVYRECLKKGQFAYSDVMRPTPEEAVQTILGAGGICSLAHPGRIEKEENEKEELLLSLVKKGLNGIEAVYSSHTEREEETFRAWAKKYDLLVTGGSDVHQEGLFGRRVGFPFFEPDEKLLLALKVLR